MQDTDDIELGSLRETNYKIIGKIKNMKSSIREDKHEYKRHEKAGG